MGESGIEVAGRFLGPENVEQARDYLEHLDPELHRYIMDFVYGEVYAGDALDPKTRALCTVAMLGCLGEQLQLGVYVRVARRQGASEEEIREVLRQVAVYAIKDFPVEKWYRDAKLYTIFEGTSEIQRLVIGRALRARASTEPLDQRMTNPR